MQKYLRSKNMKRLGPTPLWLHLNGGAAMLAAAVEGESMFAASTSMLERAMKGVQAYHASPVQPYRRVMRTITEHQGSKIITGEQWTDKNCVILIPSLINTWHIFDIEEDFSFAAYLHQNGLTPLIIDWEMPATNISLHDYIAEHLVPLIEKVMDDGYTIHGLIGYCMGGTMIAALHSLYPDLMKRIQSHVMIAPPWDFGYQSAEQYTRLQSIALQSHMMGNILPVDYVQSLFWALDPTQVIKKFQNFDAVRDKSRFVRVEDWLNDGRPLSKSVAQTCLFDWYRDDLVAKSKWQLADTTISANNIKGRVMIGRGKKDTLVPAASTDPLLTALPHAKVVDVDTGHIGLMASDKAVDALWHPVVNFIKP